MKLEQAFEVDAPVERVWDAVLDIERVAPCLPGAAVTGRRDDGSYDGTFSVKIGPTTASYAGTLKLENVNESSHTATIQANGTDRRGQGGARATIVSTLRSLDADRTSVEVDTDYQITGRLARFGRGGMIEDVAQRLLKEFAQNLQGLLAGDGGGTDVADGAGEGDGDSPIDASEPRAAHGAPAAREPVNAGALVASVAWGRVRRNPGGIVIAAGLLALLVLLRRRR